MAAATDQTYRNQKTLDIVFAVTCILMLVGIIWMFAQDQYRDWKVDQREFRNVEEALAQRAVLRAAPDEKKLEEIDAAERRVVAAKQNVNAKRKEVQPAIDNLLPQKVKSDDKFQAIKADLDSRVSFYDIAVEKRNVATESERLKELNGEVELLGKDVESLRSQLQDAQNEVDLRKRELDAATKPLTDAQRELSDAEDRLKDLAGEFDRFHKVAEQKRWGAGDWFRSLPVLDAFASPIRIQQYTLDELPINYSFKYVTRYDRCTTCHMGIDRATFSREALTELTEPPTPQLHQKLKDAQNSLRKRQEITKSKSGLDANDLTLRAVKLTRGQVTEYAAHPRLDLFVDANSPHNAEKFGCTICHGGQGSATDFFNASHMPNTAAQASMWKRGPDKENGFSGHNWSSNHFWDYPMLPNRFIESSCVKCHHQVTDLVREGSKNEAPKLLKGYNLVRENGCFGCHEIAGMKAGRSMGPDMRLEPTPPLDAFTAGEQAKMKSDAQNPPGTMRKVGPSLRRISEKTNADWMRLWIKSPRTFRPDTKMPHFYLVSNNLPDVLPADQKDFPDAEIHSITHYLLKESRAYLSGSDKFRKTSEERLQQLKAKQLLSDKEIKETEELTRRLELFKVPTPLIKKVKDKDGKEVEELHIVDTEGTVYTKLPEAAKDDKAKQEQSKNGRQLFSEKGCLACHIHEGTKTLGNALPPIASDAHFGPNLSRLAAKLGNGDPESARLWLVQWIINPTISHPRTYMPYTFLKLEEANDVASWLLSQNPQWPDDDSKKLDTDTLRKPKTETLKNLARVFLERSYSRGETNTLLDKGFSGDDLAAMRFDQDERDLEGPLTDDKLKTYIGKKSVNQLGCFGCHDVPGFEQAKPIGTPLNDWGKKDPERLAFEDAVAYTKKHFYTAPAPADADGKAYPVIDGKQPYDKYFLDSLEHHQREGFLYQKLVEPRSYDYERLRAWDDRLRMPQFKFARVEKRESESAAQFEARSLKEEAEGREAVMTFILGLLAEPIPAKYVSSPPPDRLAEIKGRQVLDKFNCSGCHLVRAGVYEFKLTPLVSKDQPMPLGNQLLSAAHGIASGSFPSDYKFPDHNAWTGTNPLNVPRLAMHGVNAKRIKVDRDMRDFLKETYKLDLPAKVDQLIELRLTEAVRFGSKQGGKEEILDIPASSTVYGLPRDLVYPPLGQLNDRDLGPYGGTFGDLLVGFLMKLDPKKYEPDQNDPTDSAKARPAVPPFLLREGEKTQPDWLFRFLRNPHKIRPMAVLRMPKFNMSDEDAQALVNYFAGADRISNPAFGTQYPYFAIKERDERYLLERNAAYVADLKKDAKVLDERLKVMAPIWERLAKDQVTALETKFKAIDEQTKKAQDAEEKETDKVKKEGLTEIRRTLEKNRAAVEADLKKYQAEVKDKDFKTYRKQWEEREAYAIDSFRLVAGDSKSLCLACHSVGRIEVPGEQGPNLEMGWQRLRPEWTERWIANPERFTTYKSWMPQNFKRDLPAKDRELLQPLFHGQPLQLVTGARDFVIMYPKIMELPAVRAWPPPVFDTSGGK